MTSVAAVMEILAREYLRVSQDKSGKLESPAEQHDENAEHAERNGWVLGEAYAEAEAISASRYSAKERDEFARLVADLKNGRFGAAILILWESSRGSRQVGEWVGLIDACEHAGVSIYVTTHGRSYSPANPRDRKSLLEDAIASEYSSAETRERVLRSTAARARKGQPHGRIPYGYQRTYDAVNRKLFTQDPHPDEAPLIAELSRRLLAGHTLKAVGRDWAGRGIMTRAGRPFTHQDLRRMALNPTYAGLRTRQPKGAPRKRTGFLDGAVAATWPPLVDRETYDAVYAVLTNPARRTTRPGRAKHLLSMIACCGECGSVLVAGYRSRARHYQCRDRGCVRVDADDLDRIAEILVKGWLSRPDVAAMLRPSGEVLPELAAVRKEAGAARGALRKYRDMAAARTLDPESLAAVVPPILAEIARLEERERVLSVPPAFAKWVGSPAEVASRWDGALIPARREVARAVLSPAYLGVLKVARVGGRFGSGAESGRWTAPVPVAERVRLDRDVLAPPPVVR